MRHRWTDHHAGSCWEPERGARHHGVPTGCCCRPADDFFWWSRSPYDGCRIRHRGLGSWRLYAPSVPQHPFPVREEGVEGEGEGDVVGQVAAVLVADADGADVAALGDVAAVQGRRLAGGPGQHNAGLARAVPFWEALPILPSSRSWCISPMRSR